MKKRMDFERIGHWLYKLPLLALLALAFVFAGCDDDDDDDPSDPNGNDNDTTLAQYDTSGNTITVTASQAGTGTANWSSQYDYVLDGYVFVNPDDTLTIEPGTVIRGLAEPTNEDPISALIVAQDAYINAAGTENNPIVFTANSDADINDPTDLEQIGNRGQWGGVVILGNASLNTAQETQSVEGIPTSETRASYGGTNDADNSGVFKYVSIRHGGDQIAPGNEINGLTLAGVGTESEIHHIEVVYNQDDGVEWFGGTVNTHHLATIFCGDDGFDYDNGFRGKGQFWFCLQDQDANRAGEHDGGTNPEDGMPFAKPTIYNATYVGGGDTALTDNQPLYFRDNAGGSYNNTIFMDFGGKFRIEYLPQSDEDSYARYKAGDLDMSGNRFYRVTGNSSLSTIFTVLDDGDDAQTFQSRVDTIANQFANQDNQVIAAADPMPITTLNRGSNGVVNSNGLNPAPTGSLTSGASNPPADAFFDQVNYYGAFGTGSDNWLKGWTFLDTNGYLE